MTAAGGEGGACRDAVTMPAGPSPDDPLALSHDWSDAVPLVSLAEALDRSLLASGLSREALLRRLLEDLPAALRLPLLALLPRGWRCRPALLPGQLRELAALLGEELLTPALLAALADDLAHLLPPSSDAPPTAGPLALWSGDTIHWHGQQVDLPGDLIALLQPLPPAGQDGDPAATGRNTGGSDAGRSLGAGAAHAASRMAPEGRSLTARLVERISGPLLWHNLGLHHLQSEPVRRANQQLAQIFNRLAANLAVAQGQGDPWWFEGCSDGAALLRHLQGQGVQLRARLRASVASFGLGASLPCSVGPAPQVPLALPYRTGLLAADGREQRGLLPHAALELELRWPHSCLLLQYYQGSEGFCGWQGLNDLHRPWQNDRDNGTVRYLGDPFGPEELEALLALTEVIALLHNREAMALHLRVGGYGAMGFCLDSTALLQQAIRGCCDLFPVLLTGIWRERMDRAAADLAAEPPPLWSARHAEALQHYRRALEALPLDLSLHGSDCAGGWRRMLACRPLASPFHLLQTLPARAQPANRSSTAATTASR